MYLGDQVIVTSNNGSITHRENNSNIKEILEVENKIEELENNKQLLNELDLSKTKSNSMQDEKVHKLDLQQLKEYRAKIIATHYFESNKETIMKLASKNKLREKFFIGINNDTVYNELENMVKKEKGKVKTLL